MGYIHGQVTPSCYNSLDLYEPYETICAKLSGTYMYMYIYMYDMGHITTWLPRGTYRVYMAVTGSMSPHFFTKITICGIYGTDLLYIKV